MSRRPLFLIALLFAVPSLIHAQTQPQGMPDRVSLTPFVGYVPGYETQGRMQIGLDGRTVDAIFGTGLGSGPASGLLLDVRTTEQVSVIGGVTYSDRNGSLIEARPVGGMGPGIEGAGGSMWFAKVGASLDAAPAPVSFFLAPALVRTRLAAEPDAMADEFTEPVSHGAVNLGAEVEIPLFSARFPLQLAVENYHIVWNDGTLAGQIDRYLGTAADVTEGAEIGMRNTNLVVFRTGVSVRF